MVLKENWGYPFILHTVSYESVEKFCLFVGYSKSGTSLIGATLDAHPNIIISHEIDIFQIIRFLDIDKNKTFDILKKASEEQ